MISYKERMQNKSLLNYMTTKEPKEVCRKEKYCTACQMQTRHRKTGKNNWICNICNTVVEKGTKRMLEKFKDEDIPGYLRGEMR